MGRSNLLELGRSGQVMGNRVHPGEGKKNGFVTPWFKRPWTCQGGARCRGKKTREPLPKPRLSEGRTSLRHMGPARTCARKHGSAMSAFRASRGGEHECRPREKGGPSRPPLKQLPDGCAARVGCLFRNLIDPGEGGRGKKVAGRAQVKKSGTKTKCETAAVT